VGELLGLIAMIVGGLCATSAFGWVVYRTACWLGSVLISVRARRRSRTDADLALDGVWCCSCGEEFVTAGTATGITRAAAHTLRCARFIAANRR
jgi:hypothetical protein